ncbi:PAS domain S-box protein [Falsirhodobacter sp. 20TX0035]|uniref:PAS domain S-box protein n=1 Tax=Falsirhodobacter sp. 20TX0035 TaxID=3022019 RepID=UPI00232ED7FC|nr:PAS domain S-box protein [Falsirhodobacter sp. 20TX0035]MDB6454538.1 PAS domain S-box protein [Falsirhodobacter sp. 20TX0035]
MTFPAVRDLLANFPDDSPLGPVDGWPPELKITFQTIQSAVAQIALFWGPDYVALYNDTYAPTIGTKHPAAFGRPARLHWSELWDDLCPLLDRVRAGEVVSARDRPFYIERNGHPETVTFDISYSPVRALDGSVAGILCLVNETTAARAYERRLIEGEQRFRNMADNAPVMMWVVDETGFCTYLNTRWYEFTGQTPEVAEGFGWLDAAHPDDRKRSEEVFLAALRDRRPFRLEYRLRRHDGVYRWAIDAAEPRFGPDGTFMGYVGSVMDIDDRHEMEEALENSRRDLSAVAHSVDQMIWTTRPDGYHDFYNDRWYEFTGLTPGSTDGDGWAGVFHPDDQPRAWELWRAALATGEPYEIEYRLRHRSGEYRWVIGRAKPAHDAEGRVLRWYGTCTDIHDMKMQELQRDALLELQEVTRNLEDPLDVTHEASRLLGQFLNVDRVGYGNVTADGEMVIVEREWTAGALPSLNGVRRFRDYGAFLDDLQHGRTVVCADIDTDARMTSHALLLREVGALAQVIVPIREKGRLVAILFVHAAAPRDWRPADVDFMGDFAERIRQTAERRRAERELRTLAASLEEQVIERTEALRQSDALLRQSQKMEAIGQLTGGVAHDFNNNLAVIISGLNLIQRKLNSGRTEDLDMLMAGAMEGAQRAATLTHRLLAFARRQPLSPEVVDANRMISGMNELLSRTLGEAVRVETVLGAGLWKTSADLSQLENAILNLAVNARDAMPEGGRLTIETANAHVDDEYGRQHNLAPGQYVLLAVSDTGAGMTEDVLQRAFDPFFTTKGVGKGTGLGLSQVFGFVRQTNGHVKIYSEPGVGTAVKIYLPRYYGEEEHQAPAPVSLDQPEGRGEAILLVEDDDRVRSFTENALRDLGYTVTAASSGRMALEMLRGGLKVDLLFTDIIMPEMTGRKLADAVAEFLPHLPVIYATGYTSNAVVHNGILDPGTNFLQKPYMLTQLAQKVRSVLDRTGSKG